MTGKIFPTGLLAMLLLFAGCRNYQPVHSGEPVRISLAPIISQTGVAQVVAPLSRNLHEQLNHARNWKLVGDDSADVVLVINVLGLNREAIASDPADTGRPLSYYESLRVTIEWVSDLPPPWGTEPVATVEASTLVYAQPSLPGAESIAITEMAEELARKIVERLNWPGPPSRP